jgi:hypothetical protein
MVKAQLCLGARVSEVAGMVERERLTPSSSPGAGALLAGARRWAPGLQITEKMGGVGSDSDRGAAGGLVQGGPGFFPIVYSHDNYPLYVLFLNV